MTIIRFNFVQETQSESDHHLAGRRATGLTSTQSNICSSVAMSSSRSRSSCWLSSAGDKIRFG